MKEEQIIKKILDSFEYYNVGLCCMMADVFQYLLISEKEWAEIEDWLDEKIPSLKYRYLKGNKVFSEGFEDSYNQPLYPWPVEMSDSIDRRWYWLKDQLDKQNKWFKDRNGNIIASAKGGPVYQNGQRLR